MKSVLILLLFGLLVIASGKEINLFEDQSLYPIQEETELVDIGDIASNLVVLKERKYVATGNYYGVRIYNLVSKQHIRTLEHSLVYDLQSLGDNHLIQATDRGQVKIWDVDSGQVVRKLQGHSVKTDVYRIALNKNQNLMLSGGEDKRVVLWDLSQFVQIRTFEGHTREISSLVFYESRGQVISGSDDSTIRVWNQNDGSLVRELRGHVNRITKLVVDENSNRLYSASFDKTIKEWGLNSGVFLRTYTGHTNTVYDLLITEDGERLVSSSLDRSVITWDKNSGQLISRFSYKEAGLWKAALNPLNGQLMTTTGNQKLIFWPFKP